MDLLLSLSNALSAVGPAFVDLSAIRGLLGVVIGVGALIFFHELGHFLAAKWAGVRVEVFSLGFGHRLIGFEHGGTDYRVSLLPLGGYVRMLGQADDDPTQPASDRADDFRNKTVFQRFVILIAGVAMNIVLAAVGFILAFGLGVSFAAPEIGSIEPGSPASRADLRPGDIVRTIDGREILGWQDLQILVALARDELELEVWRDGSTHTTRAKPVRGPNDTFARLGVSFEFVLAGFAEDSPLAAAGAQAATPTRSDTIRNVSPIDSRLDPSVRMSDRDIHRALERAEGTLAVTLERTRYDAETGLPVEVELLQVEVEVPRRPEYTVGLQVPDHAYVRRIVPESAAAKAGLEEGDRIVALGDIERITRQNLNESVREVGARFGAGPVRLVVERSPADGPPRRVELEVELALQNETVLEAALEGIEDEAERLALRRAVGNWLFGIEYRADVVGAPSELHLAREGAEPIVLQPGDRILHVWLKGGLWWSQRREFVSHDVLEQAILRARKDEPFKISWQPKGSDTVRTAVVQARPHPTETYAYLGYGLVPRQLTVERGPLAAVSLGMQQTVIQTRRIVLMLGSFFTGGVSPKELGGPITIVNVAYEVASQDTLARLLHLLAILSVNLAVINLLPIPVLDGGHIFFLMVEKLQGKPVSDEVLIYAQWVGLLCILGLMALVFFNDIRRLVEG